MVAIGSISFMTPRELSKDEVTIISCLCLVNKRVNKTDGGRNVGALADPGGTESCVKTSDKRYPGMNKYAGPKPEGRFKPTVIDIDFSLT